MHGQDDARAGAGRAPRHGLGPRGRTRGRALAKAGLLGPEDVAPIARAHVAAADAALREAARRERPAVFFDQDLLSTVVYARHYYGDCPPWIERLAAERLGDLYLLCRPDLPWTADGVRDRADGARGDPRALRGGSRRRRRARREVEGLGDAARWRPRPRPPWRSFALGA